MNEITNTSDLDSDTPQPLNQVDKRKKKGVADIVICVDVTGSMEPCVNGLIGNIETFFKSIENNVNRPLAWRARIVSYGDIQADRDMPEVAMDVTRPFTSDITEIHSQLAGLKELVSREGGGDEPENTLDAVFLAARDSQWKPLGDATRFVIVFTDATPKEELDESTVEKNQDRSVNEVINLLLNRKIKLYVWGPEHETYNKLKMLPGADFNNLGAADDKNRYEGLKNQNFVKLMEQLGKTVSTATL